MQSGPSNRVLAALLVVHLSLSTCTGSAITLSTSPAAPLEAPAILISTATSNIAQPSSTQPVVAEAEATDIPSIATATFPATCALTPTDMLGPFYTPGAPQRDRVGTGYLLTGVVRSGSDCSLVAGAQIDFWLAGPQGEYGDEWRAVTFSAADGSYHFESHFPPGYSGRPPHIHILVSAPGFATLVTQHYPAPGSTQAAFDLVLSPAQ